MVATSATRDAANAAEFVRGVRGVLGMAPEVLSGEEEARLSFTGATAELAGVRAPAPAAAGGAGRPYLVVDIGGGSTEFVLGRPGGRHAARAGLSAVSVDIGCVRMTERHLHGDPPAAAEIAAAACRHRRGPGRGGRGRARPPTARTLVGLAGSVTTVAGLALGCPATTPAGSTTPGSRRPRCTRRPAACCGRPARSGPRSASCTRAGWT